MRKNVQNSNQRKCNLNTEIDQGWPTDRSPSFSWAISPDFALNWQDTWKNIFQSKFQKVYKNYYPSIRGSCIFFGASCDCWP